MAKKARPVREDHLERQETAEELRELLVGMLDAVYVETKELKQVVAIQPKPAFAPVFQVVTAREGSGVVLIKESPQTRKKSGETDLCSWWRRGRVELLAHPPWRTHSVTFPKPWHNSLRL